MATLNEMVQKAEAAGIKLSKWESGNLCRYYAQIGDKGFRGDRDSKVFIDAKGLQVQMARKGLTSSKFDEELKTLKQALA